MFALHLVRRIGSHGLAAVIGLLLAFPAAGIPSKAMAQGFMVKPMRLEVAAQAGRAFEVPVDIRNTAGSGARDITVRLVELSQAPDGGWTLIEPGGTAPANVYSSLPWTSLADESVTIEPLAPATVMVQMQVPPDARGVYFAGLVAETPLPENAQGVAVRIRFLIPLIIQIVGRPVRQKVALVDATMTRVDGSGDGVAPTTTAALVVTNEGRTFSRIRGLLTIERQVADQWRVVTRVDVDERSIIPGVTLSLGGDLERRLPSGTYRLRADLTVDGRRVSPVLKEVEFVGDPGTDALAYDTALLLRPDAVSIDVMPGATRTTTLTIENPGLDPVNVLMTAATPDGLGGVEMGNLRGIDLSAEPWTEVRPSQFVLRPGQRQNIRVLTRIPSDGVHYPNYYADLVLEGTYADGQSAGTTHSTVHIANGEQPSSVDGLVEQLSLAEANEPGHFVVQSRFTNVGSVHVEPVGRAFLLTAQGRLVRSVDLSGDSGILLPLGKRVYSADLDLSDLEPGYYALRAEYRLSDGKAAARQQVVMIASGEVEGPDGEMISAPVVTLDPDNAALPEGVEIETGPGAAIPGEPE